MAISVIRALHALGARRLAVATAYSDEVNFRLSAFLTEHGFSTGAIRGLGIEGVRAVEEVPGNLLQELASRVIDESGGADSLLISCGGLRSLHLVPALERVHDIPVVSSSPAAFWDVVRLAAHPPIEPGD